jgi:arginyl-tRNA synthetase
MPCPDQLDAAQGRGEGFAPSAADLAGLGPEELALVKLAAQFPRLVEAAAVAREPHRIGVLPLRSGGSVPFLLEPGQRSTRKTVHPGPGWALTAARLFLAAQIGQVVRNGLAILGVEAAEEL